MPRKTKSDTVNFQPPKVPDNEWKDLQFRFDGKWIPNVDASLIGANNYASLINMRYRDSGLEGVSGYSRINVTTSLDGHATLGDFPFLRNGFQLRAQDTQKTYTLVQSLDAVGGQGRVFMNRTDIGDEGDFDATSDFDINGNPYYEDSKTALVGRFSDAPQGNIVYCNSQESMIFGGDEQQVAAAFLCDDADGTNPVDVTDIISNSQEDAANVTTIDRAGKEFLMFFTTRPIQAGYLYITDANTVDSTQTWKYWTGTTWSADVMNTDGTRPAAKAMAQSGRVKLDAHTDGLVSLKHFEELYLYAYLIELVDGTNTAAAGIFRMTVDTAFQGIKDVWDGIYRQPIQAQWEDSSAAATYDYTLQANEPSSVSAPVGFDISQMESGGDYAIVMFTDQMAAIRFNMLGSLINANVTAVLTLEYWNGSAWTTLTNGAHNWVDATSGFVRTGVMSWTPQTDEQPQTLYSSFGYAYRIKTTIANISGTVGDANVVIDIVSGIPSQEKVKPFDFGAQYKSRVMLCSYSVGNQSNRIDFSSASAPDVYNGIDTSDSGTASLKFGGIEPITAAAQLYNRFGSNILTMLLILKETEVFIMVGDTPDDFKQYPVSNSLGCPAPLTLATAEVNFEGEDANLTRNVAIWLSNAGPLMFDGAVLSPIRGIENYFDPNDDEYIEWDAIKNARGWIDTTYKEYNMLIPSSSGQVLNNRWFVYDLVRRKWYLKETGLASVPQAAFQVATAAGERMVYGGMDEGYMLHLDDSTTWDTSTGITQSLKTGDFFPSKNIWEETCIRKFKLLTHKFEDVTDENILNIFYFNNTDDLSGAGVSFADAAETGHFVEFTDTGDVEWQSTPTVSINVNQDIGTKRVLKINTDHNHVGWAHAFKFEITTSNVTGGFRPIAWGIQYYVNKKDNKAT